MRTKLILLLGIVMAACAQDVTIQVDGHFVGREKALNLLPGIGIMHACVDNASQSRVDCTPSFNTALVPTHDTIHANENYCASNNGTASYACSLASTKALTAYTAGMTFVLNVDTNCPSCTLNIDNVGPVSIKKIDGTSDPGGTLIAGQPQWIFYDGTVFRLMGGASGAAYGDSRGDVRARRLIAAMDTILYQTTMTLDVTAGDLHKIRTTPNGGNATLDASTGGLPGQHMWIIISNDMTGAKTITFGANMLSAGPLNGSLGKSATLHFISDGTTWYEVSRTVGL